MGKEAGEGPTVGEKCGRTNDVMISKRLMVIVMPIYGVHTSLV